MEISSDQAAACLQRGTGATGGWTLSILAGLALSKAAESPGLHPSQPEVRAVGTPGMTAELRHEGDKFLSVPAWVSVSQCCEDTQGRERRQME